jgi:hypothetical protein
MSFSQMNIKYRVNPNSGRIHQSIPIGVISSSQIPMGQQIPIVVTYRADSTKTVTRNGYFNGQTRAFTVTRSASETSRSSPQRAKQKADKSAYESAKREAHRRAKSWENQQKAAARQGVVFQTQSTPIFQTQQTPVSSFLQSSTSTPVHGASLFLQSSKVYDSNGIPVYGTGRGGGGVFLRFP